jgi:putative peptidoglycan lipid II flippase
MFSLRTVVKVGSLTLASRVLGYVRDMLFAGLFGTGMVADAWFVAMRLPNLFRRLFAEGAFNAAFVPMFGRHLEQEGHDPAIHFAERVLSAMLVLLLCLTALAEVFMPALIWVFAPGFDAIPEKFALTVLFTGITFPYLIFMCLAALYGGALNSVNRFGHAAAAPIILNVVLVGCLLFVTPNVARQEVVQVWGVALAGLLQFLWLVWAAKRAGIRLYLPRPGLDSEIRQLGRLMVPGLVSGGITQINITIGTILASLQDQAVSFLSYADRLYQLPLALIGSAIGVVLLPALTRALRAGENELAMSVFNRCLEFALLLALPATIGLVMAAEPIVRVFFEHGRFTPDSTVNTALALVAIGIGLPAYILNKALSPGFFAREDTLTPFKFSLASVGLDILVSLALFYFIGFVGIALGTAIAAWMNCALLYRRLRRTGHLVPSVRLRRALPRLIGATGILGVWLYVGRRLLEPWLLGDKTQSIVGLAVLIVIGILVYLVAVLSFRAFPAQEMRAALRLRR